MGQPRHLTLFGLATIIWAIGSLAATTALAQPIWNAEKFVQADGLTIVVPSYSVPSFVYWDDDALPDLVVGEGGDWDDGKVRIYLNEGTLEAPQFSGFSYAQSNGQPLVEPAGGCQGVFPRVVYWDADVKKDLLIGLADGRVKVYLNIGTEASPTFDGGTLLQVGAAGSKSDIDVGTRATSIVDDWNDDGLRDLVVGAYDGRIHVFLNEGSDTAPDYLSETFAKDPEGADLMVAFVRSSPHIVDFDGDGTKDLLSGNTDGKLLLYPNVGSNSVKQFTESTALSADGWDINLPGSARSRPFVCDWNDDGLEDVLVGGGDGYVRLFRGLSPGDIDADGDVDIDDLSAFVDVLLDVSLAHPGRLSRSNMNDDANVDGLDIPPFMNALL